MSRQASSAVRLSEELIPELIWLSTDRSPEERERRSAARLPEEQTRLDKALRPFELLTLALRLKQERAFGHARQLLSFLRASQITEPELRHLATIPGEAVGGGTAMETPVEGRQEREARKKALKLTVDPNLTLRLAQHHALCTYKDNGLRARTRLESALDILREAEDLSSTTDQETLGLMGAIHKRLWELDMQQEHLERSLHFYRRGYEVGITKDFGYTAINAAFVLDLVAKQEKDEGGAPARADGKDEGLHQKLKALRSEADGIRKEILSELADSPEQPQNEWLYQTWWFVVRVAEAYFGLGFVDKSKFELAAEWLERAAQLPDVPDWEFETTARQLATLARLRLEGPDTPEDLWESEAFRVISRFLQEKADGLRATLAGKVGLSFSGGGFRAALFHVGVLAKLAELDMLRNVEVISCVSAGSIIAAHYYLELRELLQSKQDADIKRDDYVALVARVERTFLEAVQRNIRAQLGAELTTNLKTVLHPTYTRTERLGELLEEMIYSRVGNMKRDGPLMMDDSRHHAP